MFESTTAKLVFNSFRNFLAGDLSSKAIETVQRNVCAFQKIYPSLQHDMSLYDYQLRVALAEKSIDKIEVQRLTSKLISVSNESVDKTCIIANAGVSEYFSLLGRKKNHPRVCVKSIVDNEVFDVARGDDENHRWRKFSYKKNTGFVKVFDTPTEHYVENNIPLAVKENRYKNGRINRNTTGYKPRGALRNLISSDDPGWRRLWEDGENSRTIDFYKSTLIVGITAESGALSENFKKRFDTGNKDYLFGFLCFDHVDIDFFREEDAKIAWLYADILSLPFISRSGYISKSKNFANAENYLTENGLSIDGKINPESLQEKKNKKSKKSKKNRNSRKSRKKRTQSIEIKQSEYSSASSSHKA